jgi:hypothetical protein
VTPTTACAAASIFTHPTGYVCPPAQQTLAFTGSSHAGLLFAIALFLVTFGVIMVLFWRRSDG